MFLSTAKISLAAFVIAWFGISIGRAEVQLASASEADATLVHEVEATEVAFITALTSADIPKLEEVLTDDFTWTHTSGAVESRKDYLSGVRDTGRYKALQREQVRFRIYERAALSSGIVHITVFTEDRGERVLHIRYTAAYILQNGGWRLAAWHNTRLAE